MINYTTEDLFRIIGDLFVQIHFLQRELAARTPKPKSGMDGPTLDPPPSKDLV